MSEMTRRLVVVRHAKAEPGAATDHERVLTGRGRKDALAAGRWLAQSGIKPDLAICSTAARAKETWALVAIELGDGIPTHYDRGVYSADLDDMVRIVSEIDDDVRTAIVFGHNPALHALVLALSGDGAPGDLAALRENFGTAAIAVISVPGTWSGLAEGAGTLADFTVARG
ncbi:MAG: SixA phosphatase family protein [Sporichthyaceae bacterium]